MRLHRTLLFAALLVPFAAFAQADETDVKDHPDVPRMPGFYATEYGKHLPFASFDFEVDQDANTQSKEGEYWHLQYALKEGAKQPSSLQVARNYENAAKKQGGKRTYGYDDGVTGQLVLSVPLGKAHRWIRIEAVDSGAAYTLDIIDEKAMVQEIEMKASEMLDALNKDGFVALHGINFDTGKDTIKADSEPLLEEVATLLKDNADLKISVEGHTDNVGNAKANKTLSDKRAASVKKWLVAKGVAAARLTTKGWGDTKPVADNRSEDGRKQNRRVELVKK